jgi:two-component system sensor histidine kinase ChvG
MDARVNARGDDMTAAPQPGFRKAFAIDVRDLASVRRAARALGWVEGRRDEERDGAAPDAGGVGPRAPKAPEAPGSAPGLASDPASPGQVILGDDWVAPAPSEASGAGGRRRRLVTLQRSPLARKIITFNLVALILLVAGMLWLAPSRDNLVFQRADGLVSEALLVADVVEARLPAGAPVSLAAGDGLDAGAALARLDLRGGTEAFLFDPGGLLVASAAPRPGITPAGLDRGVGGTAITNLLNALWDGLARLAEARGTGPAAAEAATGVEAARALVARALAEGTVVETGADAEGRATFVVATPVLQDGRPDGRPVGVVAVRSAGGEVDALVRREREQVLRMFVLGVALSIGLSLVLASTIANPLADLAAAAETGREMGRETGRDLGLSRDARATSPVRVRIPDLTGRPDEIGRLSTAMRGMVAALYDRIDANEQFAADVAHEIKNPLASLRSAVGTMRVAKRDDQREKLLDIIEHDVRRLDRLVSDISNASRLDSELVKEEEDTFDLLRLLASLGEHLGAEAGEKGIDFITDLPPQPISIQGLEGRLAQVFVNLITNAISFCEDGDAIRVWVRRRDNRVLVVVEDTGPGIPEDALTKIFQRFYSHRPEGQFGQNSGLGLAISKQIVEAHGGVIWAENIRPTEADATSEPLGARFVVGLPV